ncbi:tryptophan--tRNA ligase [Verrucomicrobiaceae bacterium N1E253]|uniref:Tryptophan--tRNA ligase n=1 Tax=Oceaniferula marina TaxID=2748318 RepID=A0A851GBX7_9BACT|nr:tryptophan--tRNA ligase [Oceaniferula marina]NWK55103.1 tryptophan--tRNA ligase [Oceaniferula marina]
MRILTGLQPSGKLHIGNYFGAMEPAVHLQDQGEAFYFIADYHAMTTTGDAATLRGNIQDLAIDFLACGLDPEKATIFRQSDIPEVNELAWVLSTVCPMGLLERCHSYKDKVAKGFAANHALFAYPALMAADILLYDADLVPVGKDQKQHLEVTRDLAGKINDRYGEGTLVIPEAQIKEHTAVVPGLDGQKMSKSYNNTIPLTGGKKAIRKSIMRVVTDSTAVEDPKPTDGSTVIALYKLFADDEQMAQMIADHEAGGFGYGDFKQRVFDAYWEYFAEVRSKREELENNLDYVNGVIAQGAEKARQEASKVLDRVRHAVGLR